MRKNYFLGLAILFLLPFVSSAQSVANFDDLVLSSNSYWNGSDGSGGFSNGNYLFTNHYTDFGGGMYAWGGFAYSNVTDTITQGYANQFGARTGKGYANSENYAVISVLSDYMTDNHPIPSIVRLNGNKTVSGCYVTNNAYAYYSMLYGDAVGKKFGGTSGDDPDWFKITAYGWSNGTLKDSADFYLADFRFTDNSQDYILKTWEWFDLSALGAIDSIGFILRSSDNGLYGMNTPSYFCMDDFNGSLSSGILNSNIAEFQVYPNPTTDYIFVQSKDNQNINDVEIYSLDGKLMYKERCNDFFQRISFSEYPNGMYIVKINSQSGVYTLKVVKR